MSVLSESYECSVVVCTYRSSWNKMHLTLKSILMQKNCKIQIIVTDDGSEENLFDKVRGYLDSHHFTKYKLVASDKNRGTVYNVLQGLQASEGEFVKPISPGDFLYEKNSLRQWIDFMHRHNDYVMSYCDAIYYHWKNGEIIPVSERSNPQSRKPSVEEYLLYDDTCLGASVMVKRREWIKYLEMMNGKVIYAEDFSYKIMLYCGEKIINMPKCCLLYEYGTGISTCSSQFWSKRLADDSVAVREIMLSANACSEAIKLKIEDYLQIPQRRSWYCRYKRYRHCPSKLLYLLKWKLFPRRTSVDLDAGFVHELLAERK